MDSLEKFGLQLDMHRWENDVRPCAICKGQSHAMQCADCGIHRFGPHAEQGCHHYFTHEQPDGTSHELIPPCANKVVDSEIAIFDTVKLCCRCGHLLEESKVPDRCHYLCTEKDRRTLKDTGRPAGVKELQLVRKIKQ